MRSLSLCVGVAIWGFMVAVMPLPLATSLVVQHFANNTIVTVPVSTAEPVSIQAATPTTDGPDGQPAHPTPRPSPNNNDDDDDDDDDDDHDIIPGDLLEGDSDSGGESDIGNDAVSVANGLLGGGAGSAALNNHTAGSTSVFCSIFACASAAQSDGSVSTKAAGSTINASGPLINITGPLVVINLISAGRKKETTKGADAMN
ncbi:hypothetical protein NLG97_g8210 [Lecanicillium saksenae]|uniref:Uncharacterized protein n=1 Tax=Lecanicillium saksenae TaxID=468837 RepID=A0ACC1QNF3_9HYPO|nr:hypothetical protein NLG97_g8210 [Lecanicillium saksenae]